MCFSNESEPNSVIVFKKEEFAFFLKPSVKFFTPMKDLK